MRWLGSLLMPAAMPPERHCELRKHDEGEVLLLVSAPCAVEVRARILDISHGGLRVTHMYPALRSGQRVRCVVGGRTRTMKVVWNRISTDEVQTGLANET